MHGGEQVTGTAVVIPNMHQSERYSSVLPRCGAYPRLLFSRRAVLPASAWLGRNYAAAQWETLVRASTGVHSFGPAVLALSRGKRVSHNAAFLCSKAVLLAFGGRDRRTVSRKRTSEVGIFVLESGAPNGAATSTAPWPPVWSGLHHALSGSHPGCTERRDGLNGTCEFDGMLSTVHLNGSVLMYARANTRRGGGGRFVQATRSLDGRSGWAPFQLIRFECGHPIRDRTISRPGAPRPPRGNAAPVTAPSYKGIRFDGWSLVDIYLFVVRPRQGDGDGLVALFPATFTVGTNDVPHGGVFLSFSRDGMTWTPPTQLMRSRPHADPALHVIASEMQYRTRDYPVDWSANADGSVSIQIEHNVQLYGQQRPEERRPRINTTESDLGRTPFHCVYTLHQSVSRVRQCGVRWQLLA